VPRRVLDILAERVAGDLRAVKHLEPHADIADSVIGFYAQQVLEKSLKSVLALRGVSFPMMEHDLDFLLALAAESDIELPAELAGTGWLTAWATTYEHAEAAPGCLDRKRAIRIAETAAGWCQHTIAETEFDRFRRRHGFEPGTLADFEAEYGRVKAPDGEG